MRDIFELEQMISLSQVLAETARRTKQLTKVRDLLRAGEVSGDGRFEITMTIPNDDEYEPDETVRVDEMISVTPENNEHFIGLIQVELDRISAEYEEASTELDTLLTKPQEVE